MNRQNSSLVSVVMPAYRHAAFVGAAVASVLGQTHGNLELIVIDDASPDDTWTVLQAIEDPRLRRFRHDTNQGAHATLNEGLSLARGEYIAIINSDDIFAPERIETCLAVLRMEDAALVGTDIDLIDNDGALLESHWWRDAFDRLKQVRCDTADWPATLLEGNVFMTTSNFLFSRDLYRQLGGFRDWRYVHDYEWLLRALGAEAKFAWVDRPLLQYRLHESNTIAEQPLAANLECSRLLREYLPLLLGGAGAMAMRLGHIASQWSRIDKYVGEIHATLRHQALVAKETELFRLIEDRDRWIAERDQWLMERDRQLAERQRWIEERDLWIAERDTMVRSLGDALAACHADNQRLLASWSYRIGHWAMAPARWLRTLTTSGSSGR